VKILSLRLEHFRKFDQPVEVDGFGDGLNLITGPNETGKSTLLLALRAALFERHGAKTQAVKDFAPHHVSGARPTITLTFEVGGKRCRLEKSFLKRPAARLETPDGQRFEGADAEAELKRLLGLNPAEKTSADKESPAHFGVLLTPQTRSFQQPDLADGTRHSLEASIAADIAELGNQSEVDGLLTAFEAMQFDVVSKRGEPKGRYKEVSTRLAEIEREMVEVTGEQDALREELKELQQALAERTELVAVDGVDDPSEQLALLEAARARAVRLQSLENQRLAAKQTLQTAEAKRQAQEVKREQGVRLAAEIETLDETIIDAKQKLVTIEETVSEGEGRLADFTEQRRALNERRRDLEALGRQGERLGQIDMTLSALATDVRLDLEAAALDRVTLDGEPVTTTSDLRQVTDGLSIEIDGIGRIGIEPKIEPMREALAAKTEAEGKIDRLLASLDLGAVEPDVIEAAWQAVAADIVTLETSINEAEAALAEERRHAAEAKALSEASADRRVRLMAQRGEIETTDTDEEHDQTALMIEINDAKAAVEAADNAFQAAMKSRASAIAPDVNQLDAEIASLRDQMEKRRLALESVGKKVVALESAISVRAGLGLDERRDQLERQHHLLTKERDAFALDHQALALLQTTLRTAADEAKATFNAPLSARLTPYIQNLFPDATPLVTPNFSIRALDRNGVEEPFLHLSDGTREQIAILARLAFADMLQDQGLPALIVLDDALAFSDDRRLARMVAILAEAATRMQVIILTCREDQFAGIEARRLHIKPAAEPTSSAA